MKEASWHTGALLFRKGGPAEGVYGLCGTQASAIGEVYESRVQHRLSCPALWIIGNDPCGGTRVGIWTIEVAPSGNAPRGQRSKRSPLL
jgi:hypothetical protein